MAFQACLMKTKLDTMGEKRAGLSKNFIHIDIYSHIFIRTNLFKVFIHIDLHFFSIDSIILLINNGSA